MPHPSPLPPPLSLDPFTVAEALTLGIARGRLRGTDLARPFRGVRSPTTVDTVSSRAHAYATRMTASQRFSHTTAAELLQLRMPENWHDGGLHVSSIRPDRAPRGRGIIGHQSRRRGSSTVAGLAVTGAVEAWLECGGILSVDDLVVMGDGLLRRRDPHATLDQLHTAVDRQRGQRGYLKLSAAVPLLRAETDSARETMLRLILERAGLPEPEVNAPILDEYGQVIAHGDLVYAEFKTIVEYDGGQHRTDERQFSIDIERIDMLIELGWRVIRVDKRLMARRAVLIGKVEAALRQRGWAGAAAAVG
jgi:hypothetical protein